MNLDLRIGMGLAMAALSLTVFGCAAPTSTASDDDMNDGPAPALTADDQDDSDADEPVESTAEALTSSSCAASRAKGAVEAKRKALLNTIATTEGTRGHGDDGYNVTFAYHYFSSCAHHPDHVYCSGGYCSSAAGRYQFLYGTWKGLGYSNFGPANQDRGGMKLIYRRGATIPKTRALTATEFVNVMDRISYEWASLPPGRYGQPSYTMHQTRVKYCSFAGC